MNIEPGMMPPEPSSEDKLLAAIHNSWEEASDRLRKMIDEMECIEETFKCCRYLDGDVKKFVLGAYADKVKIAKSNLENLAINIINLGGSL